MGNFDENSDVNKKEGKSGKQKGKGKEKDGRSKAEIVKDLALEVKGIQSSVPIIVDQFLKNISTRFAAVVEKLESADSEKMVSAKRAKDVLKKLKSIKLKPESGKRKDLKKIEEIAEQIEKIVKIP